ncbi:hypothetical protein [Vallitalea sp.]|uniref:hypothetical protein n=1 Tax=Vallitalea sp. TaxID=1882829 RepID=UPI0025E1CF9B|nr:hypothetical protein [Vallitalea sp.]MCT4686056.1 hypothetical protein [Vallitalea sp.]
MSRNNVNTDNFNETALLTMIITACIATIWNLIKIYFENRKNKQLLVFIQDYIDGDISDKELVNSILKFYPRKGDKLIPAMLISQNEASVLLIALDKMADSDKSDEIKRLEYKLWQFATKKKAS